MFIVAAMIRSFSGSSQTDRIVFLDVGQGDAVLAQIDGVNILFDGGDRSSSLVPLGTYFEPYGFKIDVAVLSHYHSDHYAGLIDIVARYGAELMFLPEPCDDKSLAIVDEFAAYVDELYLIGNDFVYELGVGELSLQFMNSSPCLNFNGDFSVNDRSIITALQKGSLSLVLITGDIERLSEARYVDNLKTVVSSETYILKAPHHCSKSSSGSEFIEAVSPEFAVCMYGIDNKYGHPNSEVLERYEVAGVELFHTAIEGDLVFEIPD